MFTLCVTRRRRRRERDDPEMVGSTLVRRYIGRRFEELRHAAGLNQAEAGAKVQRSRVWIARIEDGISSVRFRRLDISALLDAYDAPDDARELLLALTAEVDAQKTESWWQDYSALPSWFQLYAQLEGSAQVIRQYCSELVPGLLQTRAYAEQIMAVTGFSGDPEDLARRVETRLSRQDVLTSDEPPSLDVVLNEAVLHRPVGGNVVMAEQLGHMLKASELPNVSVRVLPFAAGAHAGLGYDAGAFSLLEFPVDPRAKEPLEPTLAYQDTFGGAAYLQKPAEVRVYTMAWNDIETRALDQSASREMIATAMKEMHNVQPA